MASMEVGSSNTTFNGSSDNLPLILPKTSGKGLSYTPVNWPKPRSKLTVEQYIREKILDSNVDSLFASFSWKIPAKQLQVKDSEEGRPSFPASFIADSEEDSESDSQSEGMVCKAGNKKCSSLIVQAEDTSLTAMPCDICCTEPHFCHVCCCILCNKYLDLNFGGYSYIKCEAKLGEGYICGHVAHLNCALRCYLAGTVGGSIGLDAEHFCRLCNAKTDLISHATKLVQTCESVTCEDDMEHILNLGFCILRGSQKTNAKELLSRIEMAIKKLKHGTSLGDIWKVEEELDTDVSTVNAPQPETEKHGRTERRHNPCSEEETKHVAAVPSIKQQTQRNDAGDKTDLQSLITEKAASDTKKKTTYFDDDLFAGQNSPREYIPKEFDSYLDLLLTNFAQPTSAFSFVLYSKISQLGCTFDLGWFRACIKSNNSSQTTTY